jgi:hypothetical protein
MEISKEIKERMHTFLQETVDHYTSKNRAHSLSLGCCYIMEGNEGCAIGRKLDDDYKIQIRNEGLNSVTTVVDLFESLGTPEYFKDIPTNFLYHVQLLHDNKDYWDKDGINITGVSYVENTIKNYELPEIKFKTSS